MAKKITLEPTPGTASAGFMFETALNENGVFEVHPEDETTLILLKRWGAKELPQKKEEKKS